MQSAPSVARQLPPPFPPPQAGEGDGMADGAGKRQRDGMVMTGQGARRGFALPLHFLRRSANILVVVTVTFFGLLLVTFLIGRVMPIDPVLAVVGDRATAELYQRTRLELGLDLPLYQQFYLYATKVLHGDFGRSVLTSNPVLSDIVRFFPATLEPATLATIFCAALRVPLGVAAAAIQDRCPHQL